MQKITFVTSNPAKAKYLSDYFHFPVDHVNLDLKEIQSLSLREAVEDKARRAFEIVGSPVLVEDTSLVFSAMNTLPGPLIKWFLQALGNEGLCHLLDGCKDRSARAEVQYALCNAEGAHIFSGSRQGTIAEYPRGEMIFGWDPIFIPTGYDKTWAEMSDEEKHATSMRKIALEQLATFLKQYE